MTLFPIQDAFIRGEISPRLHARASLDLYRAALATCQNFVTLPHGGIRKRGGTYFVNSIKYEDRNARLIEFVFSSDQAYCLELGDRYCRVYAYGGYITEFVTPWLHDHVHDVQFVQSADVMWLVHPNYAPYKITRLSNESWRVDGVVFTDGPFAQVNIDENVTAYASAGTGNITITSNGGIFKPEHVGSLFKIEMESYTNIKPWEANGVLAAKNESILGKRTRYDGNVYVSTVAATSPGEGGWRYGATPPTHLKGIEPDGPVAPDASLDAGVGAYWQYLHSGFGVAVITGYVNPTQVTASVVSLMPDEVVGAGNAQYQWALGAVRPGSYPVATTLFEERLVFASKLSVYASKTGDFESFRIGEKDDDALEFYLAGNQANDIVWADDADGYLVIGTTGGIRALSGSGVDEALTPSSFKNRSSKTLRCSRMRPINAGGAFLYIASGDRTVAEMALDGNRFQSVDASQVSEHILKEGGGVRAVAFQEYPDPVAWIVRNDGILAGFTYQADQNVRGFHRQLLGGEVKSVAVTPGRDGSDDVWVIVQRVVNGQVRQFVEMLQAPMEYRPASETFAVDCGLTYRGAPAATVSGLGHLEGETVSALADGVRIDNLTVSGGEVMLPDGRLASVIHVGLPFSATADTLELDVGGRDGSLIGRRKRIAKVILSLFETDLSGLLIQSLQRGRWESVKLPSIAVKSDAIQLFTGNVEVPIDDSWEGQGRIRIQHSGPGSCTVRSVTPAFDNEP